jgi:hypothetical protein
MMKAHVARPSGSLAIARAQRCRQPRAVVRFGFEAAASDRSVTEKLHQTTFEGLRHMLCTVANFSDNGVAERK